MTASRQRNELLLRAAEIEGGASETQTMESQLARAHAPPIPSEYCSGRSK